MTREKIVPIQLKLRPKIPTVYGNVDYLRFEQQLKRIDELLVQSGVEQEFLEVSLKKLYEGGKKPSEQKLKWHLKHSVSALRCTILRLLLGESYRGMSQRLAECGLYRWFCMFEELSDKIYVPSKSRLHDYERWIKGEQLEALIEKLIGSASEDQETLNLEQEVEVQKVWSDTSCLKANIHHPVDWVLLRDGVRTLIKAILLIRKHGLKHRMPRAEDYLKEINILSIKMTYSRRQAGSKKKRKKTFRAMKRVSKTVMAHAQRYRDKLQENWQQTDWSEAQALRVIQRMDGILEQMPKAIELAHERIIGERKVANGDKILSYYCDQLHVIKRGKAGAETEFGNTLLLSEQQDGLILDWKLYKAPPAGDSKIVKENIERILKRSKKTKLDSYGADRGFDSEGNRKYLQETLIYNGVAPRSPQLMGKRNKEKKFRAIQQRRAQTEGRVGIFKNVFLSNLRAKSFAQRELMVRWAVLAHNLWVLARLPQKAEEEPSMKKAA